MLKKASKIIAILFFYLISFSGTAQVVIDSAFFVEAQKLIFKAEGKVVEDRYGKIRIEKQFFKKDTASMTQSYVSDDTHKKRTRTGTNFNWENVSSFFHKEESNKELTRLEFEFKEPYTYQSFSGDEELANRNEYHFFFYFLTSDYVEMGTLLKKYFK